MTDYGVLWNLLKETADFCDELTAIFEDNLKNTRVTIETVGILLCNSVFDLYMNCDKCVCVRVRACLRVLV